MSFVIPVFYGSHSDLTKIDLSFINYKIYLYRGRKFKDALRSFFDPQDFERSYRTAIIESPDVNTMEGKFYAILPNDLNGKIEPDYIFYFQALLFSVFRSDLSIVKEIHLIELGEKFQCCQTTHIPFLNKSSEDNFLRLKRGDYIFIRKFISKYFISSHKIGYLNYIISVYANSIYERNPVYQFISLMICLEVIVTGKEQLTYRLKRNVSILCGSNMENCAIIFKNVGLLYDLRSEIVHGNIKPSYVHFNEYYEYLKTLVGRMAIELIVHSIPTLDELNEKLNTLGFSQTALLSKGYRRPMLPLFEDKKLKTKKEQR